MAQNLYAWNSRNKCRKTISISSHFFTCFELHSYQPTQTCFIPKLSRQYFNPFCNCFGFQRFQQQVMPWWSLFNSPVVCTALCCANYPSTHDFGMVARSFMWLGTKIDQKTCRPEKSNGSWPSVVKSSWIRSCSGTIDLIDSYDFGGVFDSILGQVKLGCFFSPLCEG